MQSVLSFHGAVLIKYGLSAKLSCSTHLGVSTGHLDCFHINIIPLLVVGRCHARDIEGPEIRGKERLSLTHITSRLNISTNTWHL